VYRIKETEKVGEVQQRTVKPYIYIYIYIERERERERDRDRCYDWNIDL
jgi:hypothetical protein